MCKIAQISNKDCKIINADDWDSMLDPIKSNDILCKSFNFSRKQQKYKLSDIVEDIMYVLKTGISWRDLRSTINWNIVYKRYVLLNKHKIFELTYTDLLKKYLKRLFNGKLKYILTDTSFVPNKKGRDVVGYNKFYNRKKGTKVSLITDAYGIPLSIECYRGNMNDCIVLTNHLTKQEVLDIPIIKDRYFSGRCWL
jgi:hypothetical protein